MEYGLYSRQDVSKESESDLARRDCDLWVYQTISLNVICRALPSFFVVGNDSSLASNATTKYCESYRARHSATQVIAHLQRASVVDTRRINSKHVFMLSGNQSRESSHNLKLKELEIQYLL